MALVDVRTVLLHLLNCVYHFRPTGKCLNWLVAFIEKTVVISKFTSVSLCWLLFCIRMMSPVPCAVSTMMLCLLKLMKHTVIWSLLLYWRHSTGDARLGSVYYCFKTFLVDLFSKFHFKRNMHDNAAVSNVWFVLQKTQKIIRNASEYLHTKCCWNLWRK